MHQYSVSLCHMVDGGEVDVTSSSWQGDMKKTQQLEEQPKKSKCVQTSLTRSSSWTCVFVFQAVEQSLQQQVEQVSSLLEEADPHNLSASLIHPATQLQVCKLVNVRPGSGV